LTITKAVTNKTTLTSINENFMIFLFTYLYVQHLISLPVVCICI